MESFIWMMITFNSVGWEESQIFGFQWIFVGEFWIAALRFGFARQRRIVHFEATRFDDADVGRDAVAEFDFDDISDADLFSLEGLLETLTDHYRVLRYHVLERLHDLVTFTLLVVGEDTRHDHHGRQNDTQVQLQPNSFN